MALNQWIVLIQKVPKGPLSREDVELLLKQKQIRFNDLAYKIEDGQTKSASSWKFLWQFEEFDRRKNEAQEPPSKEILERRSATTAPPKVEDHIPPELLDINPEDLLRNQNPVMERRIPQEHLSEEEVVKPRDRQENYDTPTHFGRWAAGLVATIVTIAFFNSGQLSKLLRPMSLAPENRSIASNEPQLPIGSPLQDATGSRHSSPARPTPSRYGRPNFPPVTNSIPAGRDPSEFKPEPPPLEIRDGNEDGWKDPADEKNEEQREVQDEEEAPKPTRSKKTKAAAHSRPFPPENEEGEEAGESKAEQGEGATQETEGANEDRKENLP